MLNKILNEEEILSIKRVRLRRLLDSSNIYTFFNKFGFSDGDDILEEERPYLLELLENVTKRIPKLGDFELSITTNMCHNPYYISFYNPSTDEWLRYDDLSNPLLKEAIDYKLEPFFEEEIIKLRKKYNFD